MNKKDYIEFARMLRNCRISNAGKEKAVSNLIEDLAAYFKNDDEDFDREKFFNACHVFR